MNKKDIILIGGIIVACIWLLVYILIGNEKKRGIVLIIGAVLDFILYLICKNSGFFLVGIVGGLIIGLIPWFGERRKYGIAIRETGGVKNLAVVTVIFATMIFMFVAIAYPDVEIVL